MNSQAVCPCGSGLPASVCCEPCLSGLPAATAETLMRSRYTAFVRGNARYILETWHPSSRPKGVDMEASPAWSGLEIRSVRGGGTGDDEGEVEFLARFTDDGRPGVLHETSRFVREGGRWYYLGGCIHRQPPVSKTGRNEPCPCGSGRKFKRCCG